MSQILEHIQRQRKKLDPDIEIAVESLRANSHRQIKHLAFNGKGGMCAMGAIRFGFGINNEKGDYTLVRNSKLIRRTHTTIHIIDSMFQGRYHMALATMNDIGATFDQIADRIEEAFQ